VQSVIPIKNEFMLAGMAAVDARVGIAAVMTDRILKPNLLC
jgi:hypothetical protein